MKKRCIILISMIVAMSTLALSACGNGGNGDNSTASQESSAPVSAVSSKPEESSKEELPKVEKIKVPDCLGVDESDAKTVLTSMGFLPQIKYSYNDNYEKGKVCAVIPAVSSECEKGTKVTLTISNGPKMIESKDSQIQWYNIDTSSNANKDHWEFYSPYIDDNVLYIQCCDVKFSKYMEWQDYYDEGYGIGLASLTDTFNKTVPVNIKYEKRKVKADEKQDLVLEIPLTELNAERPTDMYLQLNALDSDGKKFEINVNFFMTW